MAQGAQVRAGDEKSLQERVWQNIQERPRGWQGDKQPRAACRTKTGKQRTHLVPEWQGNVPIRALEDLDWQKPGAFYVHVGTEDSLGSSLPPGAVALVVPVDEAERLRPNPRAIYLLQFGNGYRCSRCIVTRGKFLLLVSAHLSLFLRTFAEYTFST